MFDLLITAKGIIRVLQRAIMFLKRTGKILVKEVNIGNDQGCQLQHFPGIMNDETKACLHGVSQADRLCGFCLNAVSEF